MMAVVVKMVVVYQKREVCGTGAALLDTVSAQDNGRLFEANYSASYSS
jgi:hypothetical protein